MPPSPETHGRQLSPTVQPIITVQGGNSRTKEGFLEEVMAEAGSDLGGLRVEDWLRQRNRETLTL